ncbi:hypothetical protein [Ruminiclostridium papyrosolvens]|uniref:Uncharacterized protein n=1 Tax=Ruminiclostridium papyrosolvens C7 TaxID=1330534 RepID=U4R3M0_9FIRM|nr:hypothetical protein [Ruminiclostridium papyrosolvens]EPR12356.1 hypothetical protein L323_08630 [Ruminiclostridium papyrosolvens C7]
MDTLFTYGWSGNILISMAGTHFEEPAGSIIINVPNGKKVKNFDLRSGRPQPIFEDVPKTEVEELKAQNTQLQTYVESMTQVINILLSMQIGSNPEAISSINNIMNGGNA